MKIGTFGDINIDVVINVDRLPSSGEEVFSTSRTELLGGSAVNTGVVLARMGHQVTVMGAVGEDEPGGRALARLVSIGISVDLSTQLAALPTAMNTVLVTPDGERTMIGARGANVAYDAPPDWHEGLAWLHVSGYSLMEGNQQKSALRVLESAHERGIPCSLDVPLGVGEEIGGLIGERIGRFSIVAGSKKSLREITGSDEPIYALVEAGVSRVVMTSGADPLTLVTGTHRVEVKPPRVDPIDATGAGDALVAGLISATVGGLSAGPSAVVAAAAGAAATLVQGASETLADPKIWDLLLFPDRWIDLEPGWLDAARVSVGLE